MKYKIRLMISSLTVFVPMLILLIVALQVIIWSFTEVSVFSWRSSYFHVYYFYAVYKIHLYKCDI